MNTVILLLAAIAIFALGSRFYGKFLLLGLLQPPRAGLRWRPERAGTRCSWPVLLGRHFAATAGATTIVGVTIGMVWGWMPAFLWIVVGTVLLGGLMGAGTLWTAEHHGPGSPARIAAGVLKPSAGLLLVVLLILVAVGIAATTLTVAAGVLASHGAAAWAFLLHVPLVTALADPLEQGRGWRLLLWTLFALAFLLAASVAGITSPLLVDGTLQISIEQDPAFRLDDTMLWTAVALFYAWLGVVLPDGRMARPRGYLAGALLVLVVLAVFAALALVRPELAVPRVGEPAGLPGPIPWILVVVTGGALLGFHAVAACASSFRHAVRDADSTRHGYGSAVLDGALGIAVVLLIAALPLGASQWEVTYGDWLMTATLVDWAGHFIDLGARLGAAAGAPPDAVSAVIALAVALLALCALETSLRALRHLAGELTEYYTGDEEPGERHGGRLAVAAALIGALALWRSGAGLDWWIAVGALNQLLAAMALLLLAVLLGRLQRPVVPVVVPMLLALVAAIWALVLVVFVWWWQQSWAGVAGATLMLALGAWVALEVLRALPAVRGAPVSAGTR